MKRLLLPFFLLLAACTADAADAPRTTESEVVTRQKPPMLPQTFGGDAAGWRPEAILVNAAAGALGAAWSEPGVTDVIVAIPVTMIGSEVFPYGDGQSNAAPSFGGWSEKRPPLVAVAITSSRGTDVVVHLDRALPFDGKTVVVKRSGTDVELPITVDAHGDRVARFPGGAETFAVVPAGWRAGFVVDFTHTVKEADALRAARFLDREKLAAKEGEGPGAVDARVRSHAFQSSVNGRTGVVPPYANDDVHAAFPEGGTMVKTGAGGGRTWVFDDRTDGVKTMIQCFDGRDAAKEAGVPSATGWHQIGDAAETAVNDLERAPMLVAAGVAGKIARGDVGPDGFAWNLTHAVTFRWLMPGEALVSPRGTFHWFGFTHAAAACAEIVVSPDGYGI